MMLRLHYDPGSHGSQKRSSRGVFSHFVFVFKFRKVSLHFSRSAKATVTEARQHATVCQGLPWQRLASTLRSVTDGSTFPPSLPRSVGTPHVLLRCDQVLLRLSSSAKVFLR